ncbi:MAG TPA: PEGA domain-containing protein [Planctomycetaceae bacterium]|nr:PEGA domain-containing protein [Planctomycetaceae bacterium]
MPPLENTIRSPIRRWLLPATVAVLATVSSGCMHRRLTVRSEPPGAAVVVDGEEIGFTPVSMDYTYYGTREITLIKDGYRTVTLPYKLKTPWYQYFPLEFVTDNLAFTHIRDKREVVYTLEPEVLVPTGEVLDRANNLRSNALRTEMPLPGQ